MRRGNSSEVCLRKPWNTNGYSVRSMTMTKVERLFLFSPGGYSYTVSWKLFAWDFEGLSLVNRAWWGVRTCLETLRSSHESRDRAPALLPHTLILPLAAHKFCFLKSCTKTPAYCGLGFASRYLSHEFEFTLSYPIVRFTLCCVRLLSPLHPQPFPSVAFEGGSPCLRIDPRSSAPKNSLLTV